MTGLVVLGFPLLAGVGFGAAAVFQQGLLRGWPLLERFGQYLYALLLLLPLALVWLERGGVSGLFAPARDRPGWWAPLWLAAGAALGGALLAAELWGTLLLRNLTLTRRLAAHPAMEGGPAHASVSAAGAGATRVAGAVAMLAGTVAIVVLEEIVWRGYLLAFLRDRWGLAGWLALVVSGFAFGVNHAWFGLRAALFKWLHGIAWGALVLASGLLWVAVVSHLVFDLLVLRRLRGRRP